MEENERMPNVACAGNGEDDEFRRYYYMNVTSHRDDSLYDWVGSFYITRLSHGILTVSKPFLYGQKSVSM